MLEHDIARFNLKPGSGFLWCKAILRDNGSLIGVALGTDGVKPAERPLRLRTSGLAGAIRLAEEAERMAAHARPDQLDDATAVLGRSGILAATMLDDEDGVRRVVFGRVDGQGICHVPLANLPLLATVLRLAERQVAEAGRMVEGTSAVN